MKHLYRTLLIAAVLLVVSAFAFASEETVGVTINATAQIPTFIRFSLSAIRDVWSGIIGPDQFASLSSAPLSEETVSLIFDSTAGFVDENWEPVENPDPESGNVYIVAQRNLVASIVTNAKFEYIVTAAYLTPEDEDDYVTLPLEHSVKVEGGEDYSEPKPISGKTEKILEDGRNGATSIEHRFRIPFSLDYPAGVYTGAIAFKIVTL